MKRTQEQSNVEWNEDWALDQNLDYLRKNGCSDVMQVSAKVRDSIMPIITNYEDRTQLTDLLKKLCSNKDIQEICAADSATLLTALGKASSPKKFAIELINTLLINEKEQRLRSNTPEAFSVQIYDCATGQKEEVRGRTLYLHAVAVGATDIARVLVRNFGANIANDIEITTYFDPKLGSRSEHKTALHIAIEALPTLGLRKCEELACIKIVLGHKMNIINNGFIEDAWSNALNFAKRYISQHAPQMQTVIEEFLLSIKAQETPISHHSKNKAETVGVLQHTQERSRSQEKSTFQTLTYTPPRVIPDTPRSCVTHYAPMSHAHLVGEDVEDTSSRSPSPEVHGATEHPYETPNSPELC